MAIHRALFGIIYAERGGGELSNLQIIEALCNLVERQSQLICKLAFVLEEAGCLAAEERRAAQEAQDAYSAILGADEVPEN